MSRARQLLAPRSLRWVSLAGGLASLMGCPSPGPSTWPGHEAPADVRMGCELARVRCARCHSLERIEHASIHTARGWRDQVARMRAMPGAAIPPDDGDAITRCLVYRTGGTAALHDLEALP